MRGRVATDRLMSLLHASCSTLARSLDDVSKEQAEHKEPESPANLRTQLPVAVVVISLVEQGIRRSLTGTIKMLNNGSIRQTAAKTVSVTLCIFTGRRRSGGAECLGNKAED